MEFAQLWVRLLYVIDNVADVVATEVAAVAYPLGSYSDDNGLRAVSSGQSPPFPGEFSSSRFVFHVERPDADASAADNVETSSGRFWQGDVEEGGLIGSFGRFWCGRHRVEWWPYWWG